MLQTKKIVLRQFILQNFINGAPIGIFPTFGKSKLCRNHTHLEQLFGKSQLGYGLVSMFLV